VPSRSRRFVGFPGLDVDKTFVEFRNSPPRCPTRISGCERILMIQSAIGPAWRSSARCANQMGEHNSSFLSCGRNFPARVYIINILGTIQYAFTVMEICSCSCRAANDRSSHTMSHNSILGIIQSAIIPPHTHTSAAPTYLQPD
jgi:hypothetical protein